MEAGGKGWVALTWWIKGRRTARGKLAKVVDAWRPPRTAQTWWGWNTGMGGSGESGWSAETGAEYGTNKTAVENFSGAVRWQQIVQSATGAEPTLRDSWLWGWKGDREEHWTNPFLRTSIFLATKEREGSLLIPVHHCSYVLCFLCQTQFQSF